MMGWRNWARRYFGLLKGENAMDADSINVHFSSATDNWATPMCFFNRLDYEFNFTLDPCSNGINAKCSKFFTEDDDGLSKSWAGEVVFMNPPYVRVIGD